MPRKQRTPASADLNRENQRRSRARHREFVEDLQRRLREYEERGAQATLHMQRASRAVAAENAALRNLLAERGADPAEVTRYLIARLGVADAASALEAQDPAVSSLPSPPPQSESRLSPETSALSILCAAVSDAAEKAAVPPAALAQIPQAEAGTRQVAPGTYLPHSNNSAPGFSNVSSCDEAANILVQLRGRPDAASARAALGYSETSQCLINTAYLMQLMSQMT